MEKAQVKKLSIVTLAILLALVLILGFGFFVRVDKHSRISIKTAYCPSGQIDFHTESPKYTGPDDANSFVAHRIIINKKTVKPAIVEPLNIRPISELPLVVKQIAPPPLLNPWEMFQSGLITFDQYLSLYDQLHGNN
jgi:hypothetical protein